MNRLQTLLETEPNELLDQFEKSFKKVFGIPAEIENYDGGILFDVYGERFSIDFESNLLWYLDEKWEKVTDLQQARELWKKK